MKQVAIHGAGVEIPPWDVNHLPHALSTPAALAAVEAFNQHAPTHAAEKSKRGAGGRGSAEHDGAAHEDSKRARDSSQPEAFVATTGIRISNLSAVADFERELAAAPDFSAKVNVFQAFTEAMSDWAAMFSPSPESTLYPLIISCLRAMRRACFELKHPGMYETALTMLFEHKQNVGAGGGVW